MTRLPLLLVGLLATALSAQVPVPSVIKPNAEFAQPFAAIVGFRELADGRMLVSDSRLGEIQLIEFKSGKSEPVSRQGSGPDEYRSVGAILSLSRDTSAMFDARNARLLLLNEKGEPIGTEPVASNQIFLMQDAGWSDMMARIYSTVWIRPTDDRQVTDSAYIVAYNIHTKHLDTIAPIRNAPMDLVKRQSGNSTMIRSTEIPFSVHDEWTITTDGRLAIAMGHDYHLEYYQYGKPRKVAAATPFTALKVTDAEKDSVRASRRADARPGQIPVSPEPSVWQKTMPPFGAHSIHPAPNGRVVIERSRSLATNARTYDIFSSSGVRQYSVTLPPMTRLIGAGLTAEYAIRVDADGQQFLERFVLR